MKNTKNRKMLIAIAIAVTAAIFAGMLVITSLSSQKTTVYVFKNNYEAGTAVTSDMFSPLQIDSKILMAGAKGSVSTALITRETFTSSVKNGDVLKLDVTAGTPLMKSLLSSAANNDVEIRMDPTSVAVTIAVNNTTGVTNAIKPESHVNVYATYSSGGTYLLLENERVLSVIVKDGVLSGITLELNNEKAIKVINAANGGKLYCGLVNGNGYIYVEEE